MPAATAMMSTDEVSARDKVPYWRDWVWKLFGGLDSDLYGDTEFDGRISSTRAGEVVLTRLESGRHRVMRSKSLVRASDQGYLKIVAPQRGCAGVEQQGRQAWVGPGEWSIYDTTETYSVANPEPVEHLIVMLPKADLAERGLPLQELMARPLGGGHGIARLALETMRSAYQELPEMSDEAARGVGAAITQLVHLSLLDLAGRGTALTKVQALRDRIKELVAHRLGDPGLTVDDIALALRCSRRQLYNAFADEPEGVAGYLLRERLEAVRHDLADPTQMGHSITDIAMLRGFNSLPHFSRVFAQRFGIPPSVYRREGFGQTVLPR
ncbi:helix-turn-helix domain-containing protein [Aquabacterium sp.]|uniref:AraC-like ligand-binding domain-containing protein n=1 Tax=Aquabacterium sp. TaxID=1872578 RepID=UPI002C4D3950|nr:helix-turn-helix domain-containing protein [Aquabacterium sp.]HSW05968.1 helix-turn-helix domain-containing protein [Aquabacterium sp.]